MSIWSLITALANDRVGLFLLDCRHGVKRTRSSRTRRNAVDFARLCFPKATDELVGTAYVDDRIRIYWRDKDREADYTFLKKQLSGKENSDATATRD